jgi:DNA-binding XRE family transcriptional regulator
MENESQGIGSSSLNGGRQQSTSLNSKHSLIQRLMKSGHARAKFVESHISKALAFQIRSLREKEGWSQQILAEKISSNQNSVYRAENPNYGKQTLTTLKKIAAAFDVALVVRFVPFSELVDWVNGTPHTVEGLTTSALTVANFKAECGNGTFGDQAPVDLSAGAADSAGGLAGADLGELPSVPSARDAAMQPWMLGDRSAGARQAARI